MVELLNKLNNIQYEELDIDDILDKRESDPFDSEWMRVYREIKELKKGRNLMILQRSRKKHLLQFTKNRTMTNWRDIFLMILD